VLRNRFYYRVKPFVPWNVRLAVRRWFAVRKRATMQDWPIKAGSETAPVNWRGWPDGKRFAVVLTHDVERAGGVKKCEALMRMEQRAGFFSSFNFIPEGEYKAGEALRSQLTANGFEVGVHDLRHDGKLYRSRKEFAGNAMRINRYLREWDAVGFRSGFMLHNLDWLHDLEIQYDTSTFDTDPFEPQPHGSHTIFPFWVRRPRHPGAANSGERAGYAELPYTLPQDSTLFLLLRERTIDIWKTKLDWVAKHGGMVLLDTHPDYMGLNGHHRPWEYPVALYQEFLQYIRERYAGEYWLALPRQVSAFVHADMKTSMSATSRSTFTREVAGANRTARVWIDLDNSPHVPFFDPIIRELKTRGHEVICTARDAYQVREMVALKSLSCEFVGRHYGRHKAAKLIGTVYRCAQLLPLAFGRKPDVAISHGSRSQMLAARLLGIPSILIDDYEHSVYPPLMRPNWEITPDCIPSGDLPISAQRVRKYSGIKEEVYVPEFIPDPAILSELRLAGASVIATVRPPATEAHYHKAAGESLFFEAVDFLLSDPGIRVILVPRNERQLTWVQSARPAWFEHGRVCVPKHAVDGLNLIFHSDLVVSGGGTMNREAAALGVPAYSILKGPIGEVDRWLASAGRLIQLNGSSDIKARLKISPRNKAVSRAPGESSALRQILSHVDHILEIEMSSRTARRTGAYHSELKATAITQA
jgi:predicted glycosyltransferase